MACYLSFYHSLWSSSFYDAGEMNVDGGVLGLAPPPFSNPA